MADDNHNPDLDLEDTAQPAAPAEEAKTEPAQIVPPVPPPLIQHEYHQHDGRRWPSIIIFIVIALALATLVVFSARGIYHHFHHKNHHGTSQSSGSVPSQPSGSTSTKTKHHKSNSAVPNTGPGNVLELFVGTVFVVTSIHYIYQLRRTQ